MRKAIWITLLIMGLNLINGGLVAQISSKYAFTQSSSVWEPIWGNYATGAMADEGLSTPVDIWFTFPYGSYNYTQVKLSSNGWLGLGTALNNPYWNNDLTISPILAPLWDDLSTQYGAVQYQTFGNPPYRIFIAQWLAAKWNAYAMNEFNFMARLHESGQIDFIYGPHIGTPNNPSASIGISMSPGSTGNYYSILPGTPATASTTTQYQNIQTPLPENLMYIFMPKTAHQVNAAALNLDGPKNPLQNHTATYTVTVGNAGNALLPGGSVTAYLMQGDDILTSAEIPAMSAGGFATATLDWAPATPGLAYIYAKVVAAGDVDSLNNKTFPYTITVQEDIGVEEDIISASVSDVSSYPNPFKQDVSLQYALNKAAQVSIRVYNLKGQLVRELANGVKTSGRHTEVWKGADNGGRSVPNGVYLFVVKTDSQAVSSKVMLMR